MNKKERFDLIKRNTEEIVKEDELKEVFDKDDPVAYIGYAPTGFMHTGHMVPVFKIADFLKAGFKFKFLLANLHAYLDDEKSPWKLLDARAECYKHCVLGLMEGFGIEEKDIEFVKGTDFELEEDYFLNVLQMMGDVTINRAERAASEVVRFSENARLGGYVYPLFQVEDVKALDADVALGGIDQRGIYMLGRELMDKMDRDKYVCVFTPLLPGLTGDKMSASNEASKIGLIDTKEEVESKVDKAYCPAGEVEGNGLLAFCKHLIMPLKNDLGENFLIERPEKYGGNLEYDNYEVLEEDFRSEELHPQDLKNTLSDEINDLLEPVRERFKKREDLVRKAYPDQEFNLFEE